MKKKRRQSALEKVFGAKEVKEWLAAGDDLDDFFETLPGWFQNIVQQIGGSISKAHGLPKRKTFNSAMIGTLAGQFLASSKMILKKEPGEKMASPAAKKFLRETRKWFKFIRPFLREISQKLTEYADSLPLAKATAFNLSKAKAVQRNMKGSGFWETDATQTYIALILLSPWIENRRITSVNQLHKALCKIVGKNRAGDLKRTEGICRRIKLKFGPRGRPKKSVMAPA